jgi:plasmid stabilization system protein ParE
MLILRLSRRARRDLGAIIRRSEQRFGLDAAERYRNLITQSLRDIRANPLLLGSTARPDLMRADARVYHLRHSRDHVSGAKVGNPRHLILYRPEGAELIVARFLFDGSDLQRHIPKDLRG